MSNNAWLTWWVLRRNRNNKNNSANQVQETNQADETLLEPTVEGTEVETVEIQETKSEPETPTLGSALGLSAICFVGMIILGVIVAIALADRDSKVDSDIWLG